MREVAAQALDIEPAGRVAHRVEREQVAATEPPAPGRPDQQERERDVPQRLVQERGLVVPAHGLPEVAEVARLGLARRHVQVVNLQLPRHVRRAAVELVVEPVAPPADPLRRSHAGCGGVGERGEPDVLASAADPRAEHPERDGSPDAQAAVPDLQCVDGVLALAEVLLPVGGDVVEPPADDAERDRPAGDVPDVLVLAATRAPAAGRDGERDEDAGHDAQGVRPNRDRADMPDGVGGTRYRGQRLHAARVAVCARALFHGRR